MKKYTPMFVVLVVIIGLIWLVLSSRDSAQPIKQSEQKQEVTNQEKPSMQLPKPEMTIDTSKTYEAVLHTSKGDITVMLNADKTPITVNNFVYLAKKGFYNNSPFHRIIKGFMIQGGDPTGTGRGGPGYKFDDEAFDGSYERGVIAMANSGPNTNGSQFFIMHKDNPLPKNYVIFGKVEKGLDVVDLIAESKVSSNDFGEASTPVELTRIKSVDILEK